jgi:hypothetical protein
MELADVDVVWAGDRYVIAWLEPGSSSFESKVLELNAEGEPEGSPVLVDASSSSLALASFGTRAYILFNSAGELKVSELGAGASVIGSRSLASQGAVASDAGVDLAVSEGSFLALFSSQDSVWVVGFSKDLASVAPPVRIATERAFDARIAAAENGLVVGIDAGPVLQLFEDRKSVV